EPLVGELVRLALRLGYHVVAYEAENRSAAHDPLTAANERETAQARNLKERILAKDPHAKIIVHAGYNHIAKRPWGFGPKDKRGELQNMASAFKTLTGIDPLSVDQTTMMEHDTPAAESPPYKLAIELGLVKHTPVVLRERKTRAYFVPVNDRGSYDLVVFHPRTRYENGRPTWMALGGARQQHPLPGADRPSRGTYFLAQAFYPGEDAEKAVPAD